MSNMLSCVLSVCIYPEFPKAQISLFMSTKYVHASITFDVNVHIPMLASSTALYIKFDRSDRDILIPYYVCTVFISTKPLKTL
jgi:hypothetical protein